MTTDTTDTRTALSILRLTRTRKDQTRKCCPSVRPVRVAAGTAQAHLLRRGSYGGAPYEPGGWGRKMYQSGPTAWQARVFFGSKFKG
jgi:hypothetical protein